MDRDKFVESWKAVPDKVKSVSFAGGWFICTGYEFFGPSFFVGTVRLFSVREYEAVIVGYINVSYILEVK